MTDGGWEVCEDEPYRPKSPCLVYSFGSVRDRQTETHRRREQEKEQERERDGGGGG